MKIKLLNNCGFIGMDKVAFPVEVEAVESVPPKEAPDNYFVCREELLRVGAQPRAFIRARYCWHKEDVEVVDEA